MVSISIGGNVMDRIDWKILTELESDGRLSFADLSERVGLSKSPCWTRVQELEASGAIQGFTTQINPAALGLSVHCYVLVRIRFDSHPKFEEAAMAHPAIIECYTIAGDSDYLIRVYAQSVEHLDELLRHDLSKLPGVHRLSTTVCLKVIKARAPLMRWAQPPKEKRS
jgi:Lrp/AsnC family transcriptional regulator, leucine-responsive regulatory protein